MQLINLRIESPPTYNKEDALRAISDDHLVAGLVRLHHDGGGVIALKKPHRQADSHISNRQDLEH